MPALDLLATIDDADREAFQSALPRAGEVAKRTPLVRVVVPRHEDRAFIEAHEIFIDGLLRLNHKSAKSRRIEIELGAGDAVYFHAGCASPEYGRAVFALQHISQDVEVTPFGLGALICTGKSSDPLHKAGSCVSPVAHWSRANKVSFVRDSTWRDDWRDRFADYLACYFGGQLDRYFSMQASGKPQVVDPERIFASRRNKDWRIWTLEVRVLGDVNLFDAVRAGTIVLWGVPPNVEKQLKVAALAARRRLSHMRPLWAQLPRDKRRTVASVSPRSIFAAINRELAEVALR